MAWYDISDLWWMRPQRGNLPELAGRAFMQGRQMAQNREMFDEEMDLKKTAMGMDQAEAGAAAQTFEQFTNRLSGASSFQQKLDVFAANPGIWMNPRTSGAAKSMMDTLRTQYDIQSKTVDAKIMAQNHERDVELRSKWGWDGTPGTKERAAALRAQQQYMDMATEMGVLDMASTVNPPILPNGDLNEVMARRDLEVKARMMSEGRGGEVTSSTRYPGGKTQVTTRFPASEQSVRGKTREQYVEERVLQLRRPEFTGDLESLPDLQEAIRQANEEYDAFRQPPAQAPRGEAGNEGARPAPRVISIRKKGE